MLTHTQNLLRWIYTVLLVTLALLGLHSQLMTAQTVPGIPTGDIRVHYFRPDGNYTGWTIYAFFDTTEPNNFQAGPVPVTGTDSFGAYFDVGVTANAQNVGLILHNGSTKDPGPNQYVNPATQGNEFWELSGSDQMLTHRPSTDADPAARRASTTTGPMAITTTGACTFTARRPIPPAASVSPRTSMQATTAMGPTST